MQKNPCNCPKQLHFTYNLNNYLLQIFVFVLKLIYFNSCTMKLKRSVSQKLINPVCLTREDAEMLIVSFLTIFPRIMNCYCALSERVAIVDWRSVSNCLKTRSGTVHWVTRMFTNSYPSFLRRLWLMVSLIENSMVKCLLIHIPSGDMNSNRYVEWRYLVVWLIKRKIVRYLTDVKRNGTFFYCDFKSCRLSLCCVAGRWNFNHRFPSSERNDNFLNPKKCDLDFSIHILIFPLLRNLSTTVHLRASTTCSDYCFNRSFGRYVLFSLGKWILSVFMPCLGKYFSY